MATFEPGQLVDGKYRVERLIGLGGMGEVWAGTNEHTGKQVALKVILRALASTPEARELFTTEGLVASKVNHPNVVSVFDVIEHEGMACIVMELLEGEPLSDLLERNGRLNAQEAAWLLIPAMRGVAAAHAQGVIHRDLKPQNIFLCTEPDGRIVTTKVLDFGISVLIDSVIDRSLGPFVGTPNYMPPEHLAGVPVIDGRADVYGFGLLLYETLTGRMAFPGEIGEELFCRIINQPAPSLADLRPDISQGMVQIIDKAMAKPPDLRFANLNELVAAIEAELQALGLGAPTASTLPGPSELAARIRTTPSLAVPVGHQETVVMYLDASKTPLARGSSAAVETSAAVRPTQGLLARVAHVFHQGWMVALAGAVCVPLGVFVVWIAHPSPPKAAMNGDKAGVRQRAPVIEPLVPRETFSEPSAPRVSAPQPSRNGVLEPPVISRPRKKPSPMRVAKQTSKASSSLDGQGRALDRALVLPRSQAVKQSPPVPKFSSRAGGLSVDDF